MPEMAGGCAGLWLAWQWPCRRTWGWWLLQVITPFRKLILCAENRKEMEDWITALKSVQKWEIHEVMWAGCSMDLYFCVECVSLGVPLTARQELLSLASPHKEDRSWAGGTRGARREGVPAEGARH